MRKRIEDPTVGRIVRKRSAVDNDDRFSPGILHEWKEEEEKDF